MKAYNHDMPFEHTDMTIYEALGIRPERRKPLPESRQIEAADNMTVEELLSRMGEKEPIHGQTE